MTEPAEGTPQVTEAPVQPTTVEQPAPVVQPPAGGEPRSEAAPAAPAQPVEDARIAGLNRKLNELQDQLATERNRRLEAEKRSLSPEELEQASKKDLEVYVQRLEQELSYERMQTAKDKILQKYPSVKPFEDLLDADDPDSLESLAEDLAERIATIGGGQQTPEQFKVEGHQGAVQRTVEQAQAPAPQVLPGSPGYQGPNADDELDTAAAAYQKERHKFGGVMNALFAKQVREGKTLQ